MEVACARFKELAEQASGDANLRAVLERATTHFLGKRQAALEALPGREAHFARAAAARTRALARLPELLEQLEARCLAAGAQVHWAEDAAQARGIVSGIAQDCGARIVVKGKSMITEEIGLNPALEALGMEVWETDLGEFIVQLAGEPPSHIIAPAIHKSREDVSELFRQKLGRSGESIPELTLLARQALREKFLAADLGITGVNMAVAETGSLVLLENEGNIRMSTTCPGVHVAVMSLEKVAATLEDAVDLLRVLPRSATGQRLSSYVSVLTGPRRPGETDGPKACHLIILDNGRSSALADPDLRGALACIRCGACLNACPVYQTIGGHAYGWIYSGPIGTILSSLLLPRAETLDLPFASTLCGACARACPVGVDHPRMLLALRRRAFEAAGNPLVRAHAFLAAHPALYRLAMGLGRAVDPNLDLLPKLPGLDALGRYAHFRQPPELQRPCSAQLRARRRKERP